MGRDIYRDIYNSVWKKSFMNELLSFKDLSEYCDLIIKDQNLGDYVCHFEENNEMPNGAASYSHKNKCIEFNIDYCTTFVNIYGIFITNYQMLQFLLHELNHAKQKMFLDSFDFFDSNNSKEEHLRYMLVGLSSKKINKTPDDFKNLEDFNKYYGSLNVNFKTYQDVYQEYYKYNPSERFAELDSLYDMYGFIYKYENNKDLKDFLLGYFYTRIVETEIRGYYAGKDEVYPPTETFIDCMNIDEYFKNIWINIVKLNENELVIDPWYYGLKVSYDDYVLKKDFLDNLVKDEKEKTR